MPEVPTPATAQMLANRALQCACSEDCVRWAEELLEVGIDSSAIRQLAGAPSGTSASELTELRDRGLADLGLAGVSTRQALLLYVRMILATTSDMTQAYSLLAALYQKSQLMDVLLPFWLLHWASFDLATGAEQHYVDNVTRDNIDEAMASNTQAFLATFEQAYSE